MPSAVVGAAKVCCTMQCSDQLRLLTAPGAGTDLMEALQLLQGFWGIEKHLHLQQAPNA